jgi:hypothetical protein
MEKEYATELDCKRQCDVDAKGCEAGGFRSEFCENQWDDCMSDCLSECEIYS